MQFCIITDNSERDHELAIYGTHFSGAARLVGIVEFVVREGCVQPELGFARRVLRGATTEQNLKKTHGGVISLIKISADATKRRLPRNLPKR